MSSGVAPTTTTSQASAPVAGGQHHEPRGAVGRPAGRLGRDGRRLLGADRRRGGDGQPGEDPAEDAGDPLLVGVRRAAAAGEDERGVEDRHRAQRLRRAGGRDVRDGLGVGVAESQGGGVDPEQGRPVLVDERRRAAGPGAAGELGEESGDVVLAAGPAGAGLRAQPVDGVAQRADAGRGLAPGLVAADPGVGDHQRDWPPVVVRALDRGLAAGHEEPEHGTARTAHQRPVFPRPRRRDGRVLIMAPRWSGPDRPKSMTRPGTAKDSPLWDSCMGPRPDTMPAAARPSRRALLPWTRSEE